MCRSPYIREAALRYSRKKQAEYREQEREFKLAHPDLFEEDRKKRKIWYDYSVRLYKWQHQDEIREYLRKRQQYNKLLVLSHYGRYKSAVCVVCGETKIECLSIDHINGDGYKENKGYRGKALYAKIISSGFPDGFQTLCMNCQWIKRHQNSEWGDVKQRRNSTSIPVRPEGDPPKHWTPYSGRIDDMEYRGRRVSHTPDQLLHEMYPDIKATESKPKRRADKDNPTTVRGIRR